MNTRRPAFLHLNHGPLSVRVEHLRIEATHTHPERQEATWERTNSLLRVTNVEPGDNMILLGDDFAKCLTNDHMRAGEMVRMKMLSPGRVEILRRKTGEELKGDAVKAKRAQNRFAEELRKRGLLQ